MNVQLAKEVALAKLQFPLVAELKYDGVRAYIVVKSDFYVAKTRNNKVIHLRRTPQLALLPDGVYDCEITLDSGKVTDRTKVSGLINSAIHNGDIDESLLAFNVFDYLSLDDAFTETCTKPYSVRREELVGRLDGSHDSIRLANAIEIANLQQLQATYDGAILLGYEGLILKHPTSPYVFKRTKHWAKMKETKTADLKCIDYEPGQGKYDGMIGSLLCQGIVEGQFVEVSVGSGMTDADRAADFSVYRNKVIEVKYNTVIQDRLGSTPSLFLPRFVAVRFDK